jgi:hypothetical protein
MLMRRMQRAMTTAVLMGVTASFGGCASPLPKYPALSASASLQTIADRLESVHTISSRCEMTLTDADGNSVQCEGALVAERAAQPRFRLRTWKFDQAMFDLTVADGQTWIATPPDPEIRERLKDLQKVQADRIAESVWLLGPDYFRHAQPLETESSASRLVVIGRALDCDVMCEIDRGTLTLRRFSVIEDAGDVRAEVQLGEYRIINQIPWPTRLNVAGKPGAIDLRLTEIELNGALPEDAFKPPARAVKQP